MGGRSDPADPRPPGAAPAAEEIRSRLGDAPVLFRRLLDEPAHLEGLWALTRAGWLDSPLDGDLRQHVALYLAQYSEAPLALFCHWCAIRPPTLSPAELVALLDDPVPLTDEDLAEDLAVLSAAGLTGGERPVAGTPTYVALRRAIAALGLGAASVPGTREVLAEVLGPSGFAAVGGFLACLRGTQAWIEAFPDLPYGSHPNAAAVLAADSRLTARLRADRPPLDGDLAEWLRRAEEITTARRAAEAALREYASRLAAANEELARSNADLASFAAVAAHDLKSPLVTIAGFTQLLRSGRGGSLSERGLEIADNIVQGVRRMQELIDDLLAYAQLGTSATFGEVGTADLMAHVLQDLAAETAAAGADIAVDELPDVSGDAGQLRQLLLNLVSNALKFRRPDGTPRVRVGVEPVPEGWLFTVADNGIGIDREDRERVFAMFHRLHGQARYPGTGIGLAICRRVVENHRGRIWLDETPGGGTTVRFTLPAVTASH